MYLLWNYPGTVHCTLKGSFYWQSMIVIIAPPVISRVIFFNLNKVSHVSHVQGFPVIFHAVYGVAQCDSNNSFYNTEEVEKLMYYVKKLLQTKGNKPSDIGIMARYKKQVSTISIQHRMKLLLVKLKLEWSRQINCFASCVSHRCRKSLRLFKRLAKTWKLAAWTSWRWAK